MEQPPTLVIYSTGCFIAVATSVTNGWAGGGRFQGGEKNLGVDASEEYVPK